MLGQHSLGNEIEKILYSGHGTTDGSYLKQYVDQCLAGIDTGKYLYLAHPDLFYSTATKQCSTGNTGDSAVR